MSYHYMHLIICFFLFHSVLCATNRTLKIAFLYEGKISDFGWNFKHDQGRLYIANLYPDTIETDYKEAIGDDEETIKAAALGYVASGYDFVISTSFNQQYGLFKAAEAAERNNSKAKFLSVSGYLYRSNMASAFAKIYQARYLSGLIAGYMSQSNEICYIGSFQDIPEVTYGINAFAIGVREIKKDAIINVYYVNSWSDPLVESRAVSHCFSKFPKVDMLAQHTDDTTVQFAAKDKGVLSCGYDSDMRIFVGESVLTSSVFSWGPLYAIFVERIFNESLWEGRPDEWWGMKEGMVDISDFSNRVPREVKNFVKQRKEEIRTGKREVFCGSYVSDGRFGNLTGNSSCLTDAQIKSMSTYVDGVNFVEITVIPPPTNVYITWSEPVSIIFGVLISVWLVYCFIMLSLTIYKREHPAIRAISSLFCVLMQSSAIVAGISIYLYPGKPTIYTCNAVVWLIGIGFIVFYSCLFTKTLRLWRIFSLAKKLKKPKPLTDLQLMSVVGFFLFIELVILVVFVTVSPLEPVSSPSRLLSSDFVDLKCSSQHSYIFFLVLIIYKAILVVCGSLMAFMSSDVDPVFNESREFYWVIYTILLLNVIIIPIVMLLEMTPQARFALTAIDIVWILTFSISVLFFQRLQTAFKFTSEEYMEKWATARKSSISTHNELQLNSN